MKKISTKCKQNVFYLSKGKPEKIRRLSSSCVHDLMNAASNAMEGFKALQDKNEDKLVIQSLKCHALYWKDLLFSLRYINGELWKPFWIDTWAKHRKESFPFIKPTVFRRLSPADCMLMTIDVLKHTTSEQLEAISPQCFAELNWTKELTDQSKSDLRMLFRRINPSMLTRLYKPLPGIVATFLDTSQIQKIPPSQCQYLSLELMRPSVLRMVSVECLRSYLLERDSTTPTLSWKSLSGTVTRKLLEKEDIVVRLRHDDWKVMPTDIFETVSAKFMELCTLLEVEGIKVLFPVPPIHCISHLHQDHVLDVLKSHNSILPKEYFSLLTADMVSKFPDGFDTLTNMDLKPFQWMALGQDINSGVHPCALITEPKQLLDAPLLQAYMTPPCLCSIPCWSQFSTEQIDQLNHNTIGRMSYEHFEMFGLKHMLTSLTRSRVQVLCEYSPDFTKRISIEDWRLIPKEALAGVTPACVFNLRILNDLNEEDLKRLPDNAFESIGSDELSRISHVPALRPEQLAMLGAKVPHQKAPGLTIKEADFKQICTSRVHLLKMPVQILRAVPGTFCVHIDTPAKFSYIPPASLAYMGTFCLEHLEPNTYAGITASQAMELSSKLPPNVLADTEESPLFFLTLEKDSINYISFKCHMILVERRREAVNEHIALHGGPRPTSAASKSSNMMMNIIISLAVANLIAFLVAILP